MTIRKKSYLVILRNRIMEYTRSTKKSINIKRISTSQENIAIEAIKASNY